MARTRQKQAKRTGQVTNKTVVGASLGEAQPEKVTMNQLLRVLLRLSDI